jgi:hypothetical protein
MDTSLESPCRSTRLNYKQDEHINFGQVDVLHRHARFPPLYHSKQHWNTIPSDVLYPDYTWVNTITLDELRMKYNMVFDTLVLDCEGAFYYMLIDMPEMLDTIQLIIMKNDYYEMYKKEYIDFVLKKNNFCVDYSEKGGCENRFFEVWKKLK